MPLPTTHVNPVEQSITQLGHALQRGAIDIPSLVHAYLDRIHAFNRNGPGINAISMICPDAIDQAHALEAELRTKGPRGPLHGIPFAVKDNIDVAGMPTTAGCAVLQDAIARHDAPCVAHLRAAGAIVLAKANMSELAASNGRFGYSSASGLTINPYHLSRASSGSSSGSGAAVAANFAAFALGTDSFGSVRGPASVHALAGHRPTHNLLSNQGVLPLAPLFDTVGPLARSVDDIALIMQALAPSHLFNMAPITWATHRIGIVTDFSGGHPEIDTLFEHSLSILRKTGTTLVPIQLPDLTLHLYRDALGALTQAQWAIALDNYFAHAQFTTPSDAATLLDLIERRATLDQRETNPVTLAQLRQTVQTEDRHRTTQMEKLRVFRQAIDHIFVTHALDALIYPSHACPAPPRYDLHDDRYTCFAEQPVAAMHIASATGLPEISTPMGFTPDDIPAGISWLGPRGDDVRLLALAATYERMTQHRRAPITTPALLP